MLEDILGSRTKIKILRKLVDQDREIWMYDLAKQTGLSLGNIHPVLNELLESRILKIKRAGNSKLYTLNKSHFLFPEIKRLFETERKMPEKIAREFAREVGKAGIKNIILFGSLARGEFSEKSDIDILIIYRGKKEKLSESAHAAGEEILKKYDIIISAVMLPEKEFENRRKRLDNFILKIQNEGKILFGDEKWLKK